MKTYGGVEVQLHIFSASHYVISSSQLKILAALFPLLQPLIPIECETGCAQEEVWALLRTENIYDAGNRTPDPQLSSPQPNYYTDFAMQPI
jgi:hypothetical protein